MVEYALLPVLSYLVGAIPFGYLLVRIRRGIDIRTVGSGNLGATNVARALGPRWFAVVFALDFLKGFGPAFLLGGLAIRHLDAMAHVPIVYGASAMVGHIWPVYLRFKGGKGVATAAGAVTGSAPAAAGIALVAFLLVFLFSRYVSLGSMVAAVTLPVAYFLLEGRNARDPMFLVLVLISLLVVVKHRSNIRRIVQGTESKVGRARTDKGVERA